MDSLKKHWATIVTLGCIIIRALLLAWQQATAGTLIPRLKGNWNYLPLLLLTVAGIVWVVQLVRGKKTNQIQLQTSQPEIMAGIPTLSSLLGQQSNITFDAKDFFKFAHYSPITAEVEKNIKIAAAQNYPTDKEAFYARFIGIGLVAYYHEITWLTIFGSQLEGMAELSARSLIPISDFRQRKNPR